MAREAPKDGMDQVVYPRERAWANVVAVGLVGDVTSRTVGGARVKR